MFDMHIMGFMALLTAAFLCARCGAMILQRDCIHNKLKFFRDISAFLVFDFSF